MFDRGWDLLDFFRGVRPWPQLLRLLDRLPRHSHYKAAIANDEHLAQQLLDQTKPADRSAGPGRPPITEYPVLAELLANQLDELRELHATLIAVNSKKGKRPKVPPTPRPESAVMRLEKQRTMAILADIEQRMLPSGG